MNYTFDNHLKYWIGERLWDIRKNPLEKFEVDIGTIDPAYYNKTSFQNECYRIADNIWKESGGDIVIFLSGGTDSEIVARSFVEIGIKPICYTVRFTEGWNQHNVDEAIDCANDLGLQHNIINFNVTDFINSGEAKEFSKKISCTQIQYLILYHNIIKLGMPATMGGEVLLKRKANVSPNLWYLTYREDEDASAIRASKLSGIPIIQEWFLYTPEIILKYLESPGTQNLILGKNNFKLNSASSKNMILKTLFPAITGRLKSHGWEKILGLNLQCLRELSRELILPLEPSLDGIPCDIAIKKLQGKI